ncbi:MAG: hypothetical protein ACOXZ6_00510 [Syntrophomonadaceae bacterium]|jgi:hypothetical protein|nr:hypothetical protein [Bacillota bacterium]NLP23201.1 hypothetical protein [Syntrophomonadaceae bacterium]
MEDSDLNKIHEYFGLDSTIFTSPAWSELQKTENEIGPDALLSIIIDKRLWTNAEIAWVLRRLIYFYGKKDTYLKEAPIERIFTSMVDVLRAFFLLFDHLDPDIDDNMRTYICNKLGDATWGINSRTREYLYKMKK